VKQAIDGAARVYFVLATAFLVILAIVLLGWAAWEIGDALLHGEVLGVLDSAGLVIIGFAIVETARFIAEEELVRRRELRSAVEARRSLTKFITIVVIAVSLEALVMVFEAGRTEMERAVYPALLLGTAMLALVALGAFQWLSSRIAPPPDATEIDAEDEIDHRAPEEPEG
jgi:hypothetical protein